MKTGLSADELRTKATFIAQSLVRTHGYEKFRLSDVAKEMNISHAALYKYFKNKDDLLDAVNSSWLTTIDKKLARIVYDESTPGRQRIVQWFTSLYLMKREKVLADIEPFSAFIAATADQRDFIREHLSAQLEQLTHAVRVSYPERDAVTTAQMLLSATLPYHHPQLIQDTAETDTSEELVTLLGILLRGLELEGK